jgi:hypothetical protein
MTPYELITWLTTTIYKEQLIFDKILDIYDDIKAFIINNDLELNCSDDILLIKLIVFLYENSLCE